MTMRTVLALSTVVGVSLVIAGCSDPVPPPAQGATQLTVGRVLDSEGVAKDEGCNFPGIELKIGSVTGTGRTSVTDGTDGTTVVCTVSPQGAGFNLSATITKTTARGNNSLSVSGPVQSGQVTEGDAALELADTDTLLGSSSKCKVTIVRDDANPELAVGPGRIWASVDCGKMRVNNVPKAQYCRAVGFFVFENCSELAVVRRTKESAAIREGIAALSFVGSDR